MKYSFLLHLFRMPYIVSGNKNAAVLMIGEHGADIIKATYCHSEKASAIDLKCMNFSNSTICLNKWK